MPAAALATPLRPGPGRGRAVPLLPAVPAGLRLLASVRNPAEARLAAAAGIELIDLKEPADGALGALPGPRLRALVAALRDAARPPGLLLSATTGDLPSTQVKAIVERVREVAACGVHLVKVGIDGGPASGELLRRLAALPVTVVPVLLADQGIDADLLARALATDRFPVLMLDTADKQAGSLLQRLPHDALAGFVHTVQSAGAAAGLAGSLRLDDLPALVRLGADIAGFRGALCTGGRAGRLSAPRLAALRAGRDQAVAALPADPAAVGGTAAR